MYASKIPDALCKELPTKPTHLPLRSLRRRLLLRAYHYQCASDCLYKFFSSNPAFFGVFAKVHDWQLLSPGSFSWPRISLHAHA